MVPMGKSASVIQEREAKGRPSGLEMRDGLDLDQGAW